MKQQDLFGFEGIELSDEEKKYSKKVSTPIYTPRGDASLPSCYDTRKYNNLIRLINNSNLNDEIKVFLRLAATRFIVFNYENIADYYASSPKDVQELMEKLSLVIIDFDKAIENGIVVLNDKMRKLYELELS